ncbi:unnamed protein product [Diplocarpon coronariae]
MPMDSCAFDRSRIVRMEQYKRRNSEYQRPKIARIGNRTRKDFGAQTKPGSANGQERPARQKPVIDMSRRKGTPPPDAALELTAIEVPRAAVVICSLQRAYIYLQREMQMLHVRL